MTDIFSQRDKL